MTTTVSDPRFYEHANPETRADQEWARLKALHLVDGGQIGWGKTADNLPEGFICNGPFGGRVDDEHGLQVLIALHELHQAKRLTVHKDRGTVRVYRPHIAKKTTAALRGTDS